MSLFKKSSAGQSKLKMGIYGGTGSGKTHTASEVACKLYEYINAKKPVCFFDTENGSDFVNKSIFKPAGIEMFVLKSRSFMDLNAGIREAEKEASILIIDSITHVWDDFKKAYLKKTNQKFIQLWDWGKLKETWQMFTDLYVNSDLHIIMCGREAAIYEQTEEVQGGKTVKKAVKIGAKMKSESEQGYEPSLLIQMEKLNFGDDETGKYVRQAHVVKDRFDVIDSKDFNNPKFKDFLPHIELLDLKGHQMGIDTTRTSEDAFEDMTGDSELQKRARRRDNLFSEMKGMIDHYIGGTSAKSKKAQGELLKHFFGVYSFDTVKDDWKKVPLSKLEEVNKDGDDGTPSPLEQYLIKAVEGGEQ